MSAYVLPRADTCQTTTEEQGLWNKVAKPGPCSRFRFAPSPTGRLHIGSAASALLNFELAQASGGAFLLRIEDTDPGRCREEHVASILDDLAWLGLSWPEPVMRQSRHFGRYELALDLLRRHRLIYPCFATRAEIAAAVAERPDHPRDPDGAPIYPGLWKGKSTDEILERENDGLQKCWRIDMKSALDVLRVKLAGAPLTYSAWDGADGFAPVDARPERWGDFVVARKDTPTSYHLSVVLDDAYQGITHVVRGVDLEPATDIHRLLQGLLGLPVPIYFHHGLILDETGRKLSKSAGDTSVSGLREAGHLPEDVIKMARLAAVPKLN
jgi:glutamyl-Q tRNA(Asp) synthetase